VLLFKSKAQERRVQGLLLKIINNNCSDLSQMAEGPRLDGRVNLTLAVHVVPCEDDQPILELAFAAVTREFSTTGLSLIVNRPVAFEKAVVGFNWESEMIFLKGVVRHQDPLGAGFWHVGLQVMEVVNLGDCTPLKALYI
jgi:hypothetical protein